MKLLILLTLLFSQNSFSNYKGEMYFCNSDLGSNVILQRGRTKPLLVHANETIKYLTGKTNVNGLDAVNSFCLLSLQGMGLTNSLKLNAKIEHVDLKKFFELDEGHLIPYDDLLDEVQKMRAETTKFKFETSFSKSLNKVLNQTMLYKNVISGQSWLFPSVNETDITWIPLNSFLREDNVVEAKKVSSTPFNFLIQKAENAYQAKSGTLHLAEYKYAKAHLAGYSLLFTLLALVTLTLFKKFNFTLGFAAITIILQTILIIVRVYISGRAPITNMYETVMFSGFGALILAMGIGHFKKEKTWVYIGLAYNACTLMMMNFAGGMLSDAISPLVPVLRDNFWLSTHVTTIIMSYGALALSWVLANTILFKKKFLNLTNNDERYYADLIYTCLKYGTIMLAAGIILGGVWADYSWGRFWGWDPKETWSLIVLCLYMAILHGRYTNWIPSKRFITFTAAAFMSVMMAWFGVNYILASGLHSYGFSQGGAVFLGSFFAIQTAFLLLTWTKKSTKSAT